MCLINEREAYRLAQSLEENKDQWALLEYDGQGVVKGLTRLSFYFTHVCEMYNFYDSLSLQHSFFKTLQLL